LSIYFFVKDHSNLRAVGVNQELGATETHTIQQLLDDIEELYEKHWLGEIDMAKMSGAKSVLLVACDADLVVLDDSHTWIEKSAVNGLVAIVCLGFVDFSNGSLLNLIGTHDAELDALDDIEIMIVRKFFVK
jgi:hypothetical protein